MIPSPLAAFSQTAAHLSWCERCNEGGQLADFPNFDRLRTAFDALLRDLAVSWPTEDIEYVREEVGHSEYGDALENLVALGFRSGKGFGREQLRQIEALAAAMHISHSHLLIQLRQASEQAGAAKPRPAPP